MPDIHTLTAADLRAAYESRELSPKEVTAALIERIERLEPSLHAFTTLTADSAMAEAEAAEAAWLAGGEAPPLLGIPITIKDLVDVKGVPTTMGSLAADHSPAAEDELFVERLRSAGAVFLGKTNTSEFGLAAQTINRVGPTTNNPWNVERTAGGSSGGAGAACAAGYGPLHHGTDGGGSVRVPAAYNGVVGIKPTGRRIPRRVRAVGMSQISTDGPLTRTVADGALMLSVMAGADDRDPAGGRFPALDFNEAAQPAPLADLRIAQTTDLFGPTPCDPTVAAQTAAAGSILAGAGAAVSEAAPPVENPVEIFGTLASAGAAANYGELCDGREEELMDYTRTALRRGARSTGVEVARAYQALDRLRRGIDAWFDDFDVLLMPTISIGAHPHGARIDEIAGQPVNPWMISIFYTPLANLTQSPSVAVPAGLDADGLPISVQVMAREGNDAAAIRCAAVLEAEGLSAVSRLAPV